MRGISAIVDTRQEFDHVLSFYGPIALVVFVIVVSLVLFAVIRYRRRDDELPRQREGVPLAEGLYALGILAVMIFLLTVTFRTEAKVDSTSDHADLRVQVTAFQWGWRFTYPGTGVTVIGDEHNPPTLKVPTDETVRFRLISRDVIHSFWIPELRFKRDAFPKRETTFDLDFSDEGTTVGRCAEFCGLAHADMTFHVIATPRSEFEQWLHTERAG